MDVGKTMTQEPMSIGREVSITDAHEIMRSWGMRHLPVTEKDGSIVGLLSERDILKHMALHPSDKQARACDAMASNPYVVRPGDSLAEVADTMAKHKYGCAVVAGKNGICGIFTTTDALRILARMLRDPDGGPYKIMRIEDYFRTRLVA
jgi:acetoin utilization protein AcuB